MFSLPSPLASRLSSVLQPRAQDTRRTNHAPSRFHSLPPFFFLSFSPKFSSLFFILRQHLAAAVRHQYVSIRSLASFSYILLTFYYMFLVHPAQQRRVRPLLDDDRSLIPRDSTLSRDFLDVYKQSSHLSRMTLASLCTCQSQSFPLVFSFSCAFSSSRLVISVPALWTCCLQVLFVSLSLTPFSVHLFITPFLGR